MERRDIWVSSRVCDAYYHFIITRLGAFGAECVRVAFELASREAGHITNRIDHADGMAEDVDSRAEWYLPIDARNAYRVQRSSGWTGENCLNGS